MLIENTNRIKHKELSGKQIRIKAKSLKTLFHYTSNQGLEAILKKETLRFSDIHSLNDYAEVTTSINVLMKKAKEMGITLPDWYSSYMVKEENIYVCCFSLDSDSQAMWNYYTKDLNNKGCNISFDCKKLVKSILEHNPCLDGCEMYFGKIEYVKKDNSKYINQILSILNNGLDYALSKATLCLLKNSVLSNEEKTKQKITELESEVELYKREIESTNLKIYSFNNNSKCFEQSITPVFFFIKNETFKYENEYRIGIYIPSDIKKNLVDKNIIKTERRKTITRTYMDLSFSLEAITGITVSPTSDYSESLEIIKTIESAKNLPNNFFRKIKKSNCTSRII